jgi:hypothetical protein
MGDELTVTLPGPVDPAVVDAMLWPGGALAFVIPESKTGGLAVGHQVPAGLTPVFTNADVAGLDTPQGQQTEQTLDVSLNPDASLRLEAATTAHVGGTIAMADGQGRIHFLVSIQSPIRRDSGLVITGGGDPAAESIDVLGAILSSDPLPQQWSAASVAVTSEIGGVSLIADRATTPVKSEFTLDAGHFVRTADLFVPESGTQCHLDISLEPVGGGTSIALESLSVAPGSGIQSGPKGIDIPAGSYRLGVTSDCSGWAFRLQR